MKAIINSIHYNKIQQVLDYMGYKRIKRIKCETKNET